MSTASNFPARLARRLTIRAFAEARAWRWLVTLLLLAGWLGLTMFDAWLSLPPCGRLGDIVYAPFTFLTPQTEYADGGNLTWAGHLGRFFGIALPAVTIVWAVQRRLLIQAARLLLQFAGKGHVVLIGSQGSADGLAVATSAQGETVAVLDPSLADDAERSALLQRSGAIVVPPQPFATGLSRAARGGFARDIVAWSADIADGLAAAHRTRGTLPDGEREIAVAAETPEVQRALRQVPALLASDRERIRPISIAGQAMRKAFANADLIDEAMRLGQARVTVQLHGSSAALRWAAEAILRQNWSLDLGPPAIVIDGSADWAAFLSAIEGLLECGEAVFGRGHAPEVLIAGHGAPAVTRHIVDAGSDGATVQAALALAAALRQRHDSQPPATQPILRHAENGHVLSETGALAIAPPIVVPLALPVEALLARADDEAAAGLHLEYVRAHGASGLPASGRWQDLAEAYVHANRAAVDHRPVKLRDAAARGNVDTGTVEALAMAEHCRWSAEKMLDGWLPGPRDDGARRHPNLVPWESLDEQTREKDRVVVRQALDGAARIGP